MDGGGLVPELDARGAAYHDEARGPARAGSSTALDATRNCGAATVSQHDKKKGTRTELRYFPRGGALN